MIKRKIYAASIVGLLLVIVMLIYFNNKTAYHVEDSINDPNRDDGKTITNTVNKLGNDSVKQNPSNKLEPTNMKDLFREVITRYNEGGATLSEVAEVINLSQSSIGGRWGMFIYENLKVKDFDAMMDLIANEINPDIASTLSQTLTRKALQNNNIDVGKLLDIIPEGRLRRYALSTFLEEATSDQIIKYAEYLKLNENIDGGNLWVRKIVGETGIDSCSVDQLKILYGLFVGPGKNWVAQEMAQQALKNSSSLSALGDYMTENKYPPDIRSNVISWVVSKYDKNALLNVKSSEIDSENASLFLSEASKRIVDLTNYQTAIDWIINNNKSTESHLAYDNRIKDWLRFSPDAAAKKIMTIEDAYFRNRGYFMLAEFLSRPEEKELRSQWINAITDETLKADALKKFGK